MLRLKWHLQVGVCAPVTPGGVGTKGWSAEEGVEPRMEVGGCRTEEAPRGRGGGKEGPPGGKRGGKITPGGGGAHTGERRRELGLHTTFMGHTL